jgi:cell wall-associated NlpC family hydrolase
VRGSILTGVFVLALSAGNFAIAGAAETASPPSGSSVASAGVMNNAASPEAAARAATNQAGPASADAQDAAQPTAGADLVMWNVAPAEAAAPQADAQSTPRANRLRRFASGIVSRTSAIASSLTRSAMRFIGTPYVFGGTRSTGFDCSGYVQHVFAMLGVRLPRTADAQFDAGHKITASIEPGDLVFFHTYAPGVSHVGIYLGNNRFIHSASTHGVSISSLHDSYWAPRYLGAKRVVGQ